jgi:hypothetical protein
MKRILIPMTILSIFSLGQIMAQSKEACKPEACGPEGTKKSEAKAITNLRIDLSHLIEHLSGTDTNYKGQLSDLKIDPGNSDEESLIILYGASLELTQIVVGHTSNEKLIPDLKTTPKQPKNVQQMMASARKQVNLLAMQIGTL